MFDVKTQFLFATAMSLFVWSVGYTLVKEKRGWLRGLYFEGKEAVVVGRILQGLALFAWSFFAWKLLFYLFS